MRHVRYGTLAILALPILAVITFADSSVDTRRGERRNGQTHGSGVHDSEAATAACQHCSAKSAHSRSKQTEASRSSLSSGGRVSGGDEDTESARARDRKIARRAALPRQHVRSIGDARDGKSYSGKPSDRTSGRDATHWVSDRAGRSANDSDTPRGVLNAVWISDLVAHESGRGLLAALGEEETAGASYPSGAWESASAGSAMDNVIDGIFWTDSRESIATDCDGDCASDCDSCPAAGYAFGNLWSNFNREYTVWARSEYLYWQGKGDRLPSLVTVSDAGTALADSGVLGLPTTTVIFGDARFNTTERQGGRLTVGYGQFNGIQADYYRLENSVAEFSITSGGDPILARPYEDVTLAANSALVLAFPNMFEGNVTVKAASEVQSAGVLYRHLVWMESNPELDGFWRLNLVGGYRFFDLDDSLTITDEIFSPGGFFASHVDQFTTENEFHGGEIGLLFSGQRRRLSLDVTAKVALGNMHQVLDINGVGNTFMSMTPSQEGLLAQSTNIGRWTRDEFAVIPELGVDVGVQLTCHVRAVAGYTFIYASQTRRPGDSIDLLLNLSNPLVGAARPAVHDNDSWFMLHGGNAGIEVRY